MPTQRTIYDRLQQLYSQLTGARNNPNVYQQIGGYEFMAHIQSGILLSNKKNPTINTRDTMDEFQKHYAK